MRRPFAFGVRVRGQWVVTVALALSGCKARRFVIDNQEKWEKCVLAAHATDNGNTGLRAQWCAKDLGAGHWEELP